MDLRGCARCSLERSRGITATGTGVPANSMYWGGLDESCSNPRGQSGVILIVMRRLLCVLVVTVATIGLVASAAGGSSAHRGPVSIDSATPGLTSLDNALHAWGSFPVNRTPRLLIPLEGYVLNPENGFSDDNTKMAFDNGQITPPSNWPTAPTSSMGYPLVGAAGAFKTLTTPTTNILGNPPPLHATGAQLGSGLFLTDRGTRLLPAWLFSISEVQNPAKVLAVAPSAIYAAPSDLDGYSRAQLSVTVTQSGRHITANFGGAPAGSGPCTAGYSLSVKESKHAVAVLVIAHDHTGGNTSVACALNAVLRHASAELHHSLGPRVVVDAKSDGAVSATTTPGPGL